MRKGFHAQFKLFVDFPLNEEPGRWKAAIRILSEDCVSGAASQRRGPYVLLDPQGKLVPELSNAEPFRMIAGRNLKHGEGADLRAILRLPKKSELPAQFHLRPAKVARALSTGSKGGAVRQDTAPIGKIA